ncbi:calcium-binding and coiled-coil domain-containing protein 1-like [Corticium candelabrum]|uniref:calcium-binding and coiled-coil domain-containing protein 1-like n=1 Tax=Corticium candelabrum TaxID=121492 RepID=UPI002E2675AB|nr:calcium-binding and coiled-coil domain-containing protein 1-like [Corticium candelabrum]
MSEVVNWRNCGNIQFRTEIRYDPSQPLDCNYSLHPQYVVHVRDYIGLYLVESFDEKKASKNYITFQWADATTSEQDYRTITFSARHLPQASPSPLCFAYISWCDGVLGKSGSFQICHSCGDPVSIVTFTTEQSFLVIDKNESDESSSRKSVNYESVARSSKDEHVVSSFDIQSKDSDIDPSQQVRKAVDHVEEHNVSSTNSQVECSINNVFNNIEDKDEEFQENEMPIVQSDDAVEVNAETVSLTLDSSRKTKENSEDEIEVETREYKEEIKVSGDESKNQSTDESHVSLTRSTDEKVPFKLQLVENIMCDEANRQHDVLKQRVSQLEGEMGANIVQMALAQHSSDHASDQVGNQNQVTTIIQENLQLRGKIESLETRLHTNDKTISIAKEKLRAAKSRIRDLEHALITERLSYENKLRELTNARKSGPAGSSIGHTRPEDNEQTAEEEYCTALQGVAEDRKDVLDRQVTGSQKRVLSALARLGIEDKDDGREVRQEKPQQARQIANNSTASNEVVCPVCGISSSSFFNQSTFASHVNDHFPD